MSRLVAAFISPRVVAAFEYRGASKGIAIVRSVEQFGAFASPHAAAEQLVALLHDADVRRANVSVTLRGFGVAQQLVSLSPQDGADPAPAIQRKLDQLESAPDVRVAWLETPFSPDEMTDAPALHQLLAVAAPTTVLDAVLTAITSAGHRVTHVTTTAVAAQRLQEELGQPGDATALVAPLPDGAVLAFFNGGWLRLVAEPADYDGHAPTASALAEEAELGATYLRQQFRGAELSQIFLAAPTGSAMDLEVELSERLGVPVVRFESQLSVGALMALGGALDSFGPTPLSLHLRAARMRGEMLRVLGLAGAVLAVAAAVLALYLAWKRG